METELFTAFLDETEASLSGVRRCLLPGLQSMDGSADLQAAVSLLRSVRSTAGMFPADELHHTLAELESELLSAGPGSPGQDRIRCLLDRLIRAEACVGRLRIEGDGLMLDIAGFVDESFDLLQLQTESEHSIPQPPAEPPAAEDEFEIDAEMLEVFAMEAEDLLLGIDTNLEILAAAPDNKEALWEIRRNAHTLKGAAGIVGLRKPSKLAHRVEDLLDTLAETGRASNEIIFDLLRASAACLRLLTSGASLEDVSAEITRLDTRFDQILRQVAAGEPESSEPAAEINHHPDPLPPAVIDAGVPLPSTGNGASGPLEAVESTRKRSFLRVPLETLDDMVRIVRDLVISRSEFEQRLRDLSAQIEEMQLTARRLQAAGSHVEIEFEASMLSGSFAANMTATTGTNTFDDLELDRYTEFHQCSRQLSEASSDAVATVQEFNTLRSQFDRLHDRQRGLISNLQERLMGARLVEFGSLSKRLERTVRVTCEEESKRADVVVENSGLQIDTQVLDSMLEPLLHLLKNAVVHGIEPAETRRLLGKPESGRIVVSAENDETHVIFCVRDDGRGISTSVLKEKAISGGIITREMADRMPDREAIELIYHPGLTTAEKLNLSAGRGVGMSIVRDSIAASRGIVAVESDPHGGTAFKIRVPLPLAVTNALIVKSGPDIFAFPLKQVRRIGTLPVGESPIDGSIKIEDKVCRSMFLGEFTGRGRSEQCGAGELSYLLTNRKDSEFALIVDEIMRTEEIVIKTLEPPLDSLKGVLGAAVLGTGELVPILDLPNLVDSEPAAVKPMINEPVEELSVMIVDDSPSVRMMTTRVIEKAGWKVTAARDGVEALDKLKAASKLPGVILSDVEMPRMNGYELVTAVRAAERLRHLPFVFITSRSSTKHREKALADGADHYLVKPYEERELIDLITLVTSEPSVLETVEC